MLLLLSPKTMAMVREETNNRVLKEEDANFMMNDISRDGCAAAAADDD